MSAENASLSTNSVSPKHEIEPTKIRNKRAVHFGDDVVFQPTHKIASEITPTPRYIPPTQRLASMPTKGSVAAPSYDDTLKRVSIVLHKHIVQAESRAQREVEHKGEREESKTLLEEDKPILGAKAALSGKSMAEQDTTSIFYEENFVQADWKVSFFHIPRIGPLSFFSVQKIKAKITVPTSQEIYEFMKHLFVNAHLSAECTVVSLIYIERLMETAQLTLCAKNWRPITLCGLLLASKVWQDLSTWNAEFSEIYPRFSLSNINNLERYYLQAIQYDMYITGSLYAKYYFALRTVSMHEGSSGSTRSRRSGSGFRQHYNYMVTKDVVQMKGLEERSATVMNTLYSRSL